MGSWLVVEICDLGHSSIPCNIFLVDLYFWSSTNKYICIIKQNSMQLDCGTFGFASFLFTPLENNKNTKSTFFFQIYRLPMSPPLIGRSRRRCLDCGPWSSSSDMYSEEAWNEWVSRTKESGEIREEFDVADLYPFTRLRCQACMFNNNDPTTESSW